MSDVDAAWLSQLCAAYMACPPRFERRLARIVAAAGGSHQVIGERHSKARLTVEKVRAARRRHREGATIRALAKEYGIAERTLSWAIRGRSWGHVSEARVSTP